MQDFQFLPLELWRAPSLAQETKAVFAVYENCIRDNDVDGLAALRSAIQRRVEDLEQFYVNNVDDDRSVLFEKQRLKLRKLLVDFGSPSATGVYVAPGSGAAGSHADALGAAAYHSAPAAAGGYEEAVGASSGAAGGVVMRAIRIAEDTRLSCEELVACFAQALQPEMPEVTTDVVARVFAAVTRTNMDGRMSVRDLRQWYISFGKRAMREGLPLDADIVSPALVARHGFAHARKAGAAGAGPAIPPAVAIAAAAGVDVGALGSSAVLAATGAGPASRKPLYPWEKEGAAVDGAGPAGLAASMASQSGSARLAVPNGLLEFQVRLTPEEYAALQLKRRQYEAEAAYRARIAAGHGHKGGAGGAANSPAGGKGRGRTGSRGIESYPATSALVEGPYVDAGDRNAFFYRSP